MSVSSIQAQVSPLLGGLIAPSAASQSTASSSSAQQFIDALQQFLQGAGFGSSQVQVETDGSQNSAASNNACQILITIVPAAAADSTAQSGQAATATPTTQQATESTQPASSSEAASDPAVDPQSSLPVYTGPTYQGFDWSPWYNDPDVTIPTYTGTDPMLPTDPVGTYAPVQVTYMGQTYSVDPEMKNLIDSTYASPDARAYWYAQPPAVQNLLTYPDYASRFAAAVQLADQGYVIDNQIMVRGADPRQTMGIRAMANLTWVPSGNQAPLINLPGNPTPFGGYPVYDAANPPAGSILVNADSAWTPVSGPTTIANALAIAQINAWNAQIAATTPGAPPYTPVDPGTASTT